MNTRTIMPNNPEGLSVGTEAPDVYAKSVCEETFFSLKDALKKHKGVLLSFFRASW